MLIRFLVEKINTAIISVFSKMSNYFFRKMGFGLQFFSRRKLVDWSDFPDEYKKTGRLEEN